MLTLFLLITPSPNPGPKLPLRAFAPRANLTETRVGSPCPVFTGQPHFVKHKTLLLISFSKLLQL